MRDCAGFSKPLVSQLPRPCPYPASDVVELDGMEWSVCYWHGKVFRGLITDGGAGELNGATKIRALTWTPKHLPLADSTLSEEDLLTFLRHEWDLVGVGTGTNQPEQRHTG